MEIKLFKNQINIKFLLVIIFLLLITIGFMVLKNYIFRPKPITLDLEIPEITPVGTNIILPENFPKDFPVFPQAFLVASKSTKDKLEGISAVWEIRERVENITSFYQTNLEELNWKYEISAQGNGFAAFTISKDNRQGFIGITKGKEDLVVITVALGIE